MIAGGGLGVFGIIATWLYSRRQQKKLLAENELAISEGKAVAIPHKGSWLGTLFLNLILTGGAILLGIATVVCWCFTANALLDTSPPQPESVKINEMIQVTHSFLFSEYKMKYRRNDKEKDDSLLTTPEHMSQFIVRSGNAQVRAGYFGWPWVETIKPLF